MRGFFHIQSKGRKMKIVVRNILIGEGYVTGEACIERLTLPFCSFEVCVDRVDGKSIEQYESELLVKARERVTEIYKEIVCGGEPGEASSLPDYLSAKTKPSELGKETLEQINSADSNHDLKERVAALEKRLDEQGSPDMVKAIYEASKKAAEDFLNQQEKHPGEEVLVGITENCHVSGSIRSDKSE
ncbi:hypothetical protein EH138_22935 [Salmonella enterica subsp. enterica serovar Eastbourne]|uniref:Uncharacterized protein n=1 Tax=Salmonella enterica subsp. enterica serovar Eastbourne TaxID=486993 RepID=A0A702FC32_SALET|nr:hypothetical protein [Salmonella enterica subsp. enterica serovar Eastbourne]ECA1898237.1 hypothetical protein [Salmonella enterica subsp. enterica serovar Eastbourne]HAC6678782.1 hypothetical protein [Salmonella enterica subsp. enterica serovar Eastbourne]